MSRASAVASLLVGLFSWSAFGKITLYSNREIASQVLQSPDLTALEQSGQPLFNTELYELDVASEGGKGGIGTTYKVTLAFHRMSEDYKKVVRLCYVTAQLEVLPAFAPHGVTASQLSQSAFVSECQDYH